MSETPRTDERAKCADRYGDSDVVVVSFARQLERELNAAQKALKEACEYVHAPDCAINLNARHDCSCRKPTPDQQEIARLTDHLDLMVDEFNRIKSVCSAAPIPECLTYEIVGLCDRAITVIAQRVPIIKQRDVAQQEISRLNRMIELLCVWLGGQTAYSEIYWRQLAEKKVDRGERP